MDEEKEFVENELMTKENAINEITKFFKGNKRFIEQATLFIYSTHNFERISKLAISKDNYNWEKYLFISIYTEKGWKHFGYRKGNKKYAPRNKTSEIDEFWVNIYYSENRTLEEFTFH